MMIRVSVASLCVLWIACSTPARLAAESQLTLDDLFPQDRVLDVQITLDEDDWDTLRHQRRDFRAALSERRRLAPVESPFTYVDAKVSIDGVVFPRVGLRKKGFLGSLSSERPSLKIKLNHRDKKARIGGLTNLTLNNNKQDTTLMSQYMGYALFNEIGSPAPRCAYARVTVNGVNLGVYSHVETVRQPLLQRGFGDATGTLFEGTVTDFYEGWVGSFEHKVGPKKRGRRKIAELTNALRRDEGKEFFGGATEGRGIAATDDSAGDDWMRPDFDDSKWRKGVNGAGLETQRGYESLIGEGFDFGKALHGKPGSLYLRYAFELDPAKLPTGQLLLNMKYDDGFVAYLNGHRIASSNAPRDVKWDSRATNANDDRAAFRFAPFDISQHRDKLVKGRNVLAIQGLNIAPESTDMVFVFGLAAAEESETPDLGAVIDLDAFYRFWAIEGLLGFWDGYSGNRNNFFVYHHASTDRLYFLPWGADCMFEKKSKLDRNPNAPLSVKTNGLLAHRLYESPAAKRRYEQTMRDILKNHWDEEKLLAEVNRIEKLVKPHLSDSQKRTHSTERIRRFIETRREEIEAEMAGGLPDYVSRIGPPPAIPDGDFPRGRGRANENIWTAALKGDLDAIKRQLAKGVKVDARDDSGNSAIMTASLLGDLEVVEFLLSKGARVNQSNDNGDTPLHGAAFFGQTKIVALLLERGADVTERNRAGKTALDNATSPWDEVKPLVDFIAELAGRKFDEQRIQSGREQVAKLLRNPETKKKP